MYSRAELAALVEVLRKHPNIWIIADEIYECIAYDEEHVSIASFEGMFERTVTVNGFAKAYAMTGWRLGYIAAPKEVKQLCEKMQGQCTSGTNTFAMKGAVAALTGSDETVKEMTVAFRRRRDLMHGLLCQIPGLKVNMPAGAFYFYPDISSFYGKTTPGGMAIRNSADLGVYLVECGVAVVNGDAFGTHNHIRFSYATDEATITEGMKRLKEGLAALK
jgi:aspartate aminotransferase